MTLKKTFFFLTWKEWVSISNRRAIVVDGILLCLLLSGRDCRRWSRKASHASKITSHYLKLKLRALFIHISFIPFMCAMMMRWRAGGDRRFINYMKINLEIRARIISLIRERATVHDSDGAKDIKWKVYVRAEIIFRHWNGAKSAWLREETRRVVCARMSDFSFILLLHFFPSLLTIGIAASQMIAWLTFWIFTDIYINFWMNENIPRAYKTSHSEDSSSKNEMLLLLKLRLQRSKTEMKWIYFYRNFLL